jgi:hypothetical protein
MSASNGIYTLVVDPPPPTYANTWTCGNYVWSELTSYKPNSCSAVSSLQDVNPPTNPEYIEHDGLVYYNWMCLINAQSKICPLPWRSPTLAEINKMVQNCTDQEVTARWGRPGHITPTGPYNHGQYGYLMTVTETPDDIFLCKRLMWGDRDPIYFQVASIHKNFGTPQACVKEK